MSFSSIILIEELTQAGGSTPRTVTLVGPSLPFMGAEWKSKNQLVTTWYPGNSDEATQDVLGPQDVPSDWEGAWHCTMMTSCPTPYTDDQGNVTNVSDPSVLRDALDALFRAGRRLRVTWSTTQQADNSTPGAYPITGSIVREGRAATWSFKHRTIHDIDWNISFEWVSRGSTTPRVTNTRDNTLVSAPTPYVAALQNLVNSAQAPTQQLLSPNAITLGLLEATAPGPFGQLADTGVEIAALQVDLGDIAAIGTSLPQQPIQVAQMTLAHAANALATADRVYRQYSAAPPELMSTNQDAVSVLRAYAMFASVADAAMRASIQALAFYQKMRAALPQQTWSLAGQGIRAVHLVHDGDTPERISIRYYGVPDHVADIMRANGLAWHTTVLPKGKQLIIPVISSSTQTV